MKTAKQKADGKVWAQWNHRHRPVSELTVHEWFMGQALAGLLANNGACINARDQAKELADLITKI